MIQIDPAGVVALVVGMVICVGYAVIRHHYDNKHKDDKHTRHH